MRDFGSGMNGYGKISILSLPMTGTTGIHHNHNWELMRSDSLGLNQHPCSENPKFQ
jgi:hypothetical protein